MVLRTTMRSANRSNFGCRSLALVLFLTLAACLSGLQNKARALDIGQQRALVNQGVLGVLGDGARGTDFAMIADLANVLDRGYDQRILPMAGFGSVRAIEDLLLLRGVDIALVQTDVLDFYKRAELFPDIGGKIRYLAKLYSKEFHLLASKDIPSVSALEGRRVNFGPPSSGSFLTASLLFEALGLSVVVNDDDYHVALDKLRQGEIDAWVRVDAKPALQLEEAEGLDGLHLLSVPIAAIGGDYLPAEFSTNDYPSLVANGSRIKTFAVPTVMAVYAWSARHEKRAQLSRFYNDFGQSLGRLQQPPFHPKWREVDLLSGIDGWQRF
jgi:TRAP-type uncharacterized transport system substrate-binding protein